MGQCQVALKVLANWWCTQLSKKIFPVNFLNFGIHAVPSHISFDDSDTAKPRYALVYAPRQKRARVPENCVRLMQDAAALSGANEQQSLFAALVIGPSRSSEGLRVFYVTQWL